MKHPNRKYCYIKWENRWGVHRRTRRESIVRRIELDCIRNKWVYTIKLT